MWAKSSLLQIMPMPLSAILGTRQEKIMLVVFQVPRWRKDWALWACQDRVSRHERRAYVLSHCHRSDCGGLLTSQSSSHQPCWTSHLYCYAQFTKWVDKWLALRSEDYKFVLCLHELLVHDNNISVYPNSETRKAKVPEEAKRSGHHGAGECCIWGWDGRTTWTNSGVVGTVTTLLCCLHIWCVSCIINCFLGDKVTLAPYLWNWSN